MLERLKEAMKSGKEVEKSHVDLRDAVRRAREKIDKSRQDQEAAEHAAGGK